MAGAQRPREIHPALAEAVVSLGCAGAAVVEVEASGEVALVAGSGLPEGLAGWRTQVDAVDDELARRLLAACGGAFRSARSLPLVAGGDLYGALVFFEGETPLDATQRTLVIGLTDVAATALGKAFQHADLERSYADLQASREALARTEKLRALGQMAAGVAHDLVNILFPIQLSTRFIRGRLAQGGALEDSQVAESLDHLEVVVTRGMETVQRLRDFSRQSPDRPPTTADLSELIAETVEICKPRGARFRCTVRLKLSLEPTPPVLLRAPEFVTALMNLTVNAIDAVGAAGGGTVELSCGHDAQGTWVRVADDGPGIPDEIRGRIYEPFFTTKGEEGTGLGLAMVYAFVRRHRAQLDLDTAPGKGTTFTIRF